MRPSLMSTEVQFVPDEGFVATASWRGLSCVAVAPTPGSATSRAEEVVLESADDWVGEIVLPSAEGVALRTTKVSPRAGIEPVSKSRLMKSGNRPISDAELRSMLGPGQSSDDD